jgi:hypothetical protein
VVDLRYGTESIFPYIYLSLTFLRFFGMQVGVERNRMYFEKHIRDLYGMPQPTFEYLPTDHAALQAHDMMNECVVLIR